MGRAEGGEVLPWLQRFLQVNCSAFARLHRSLHLLIAGKPDDQGMQTCRLLHAGGCSLARGRAVDEDLRTLWSRVDLRPSDSGVQLDCKLRLDIVLDLHVTSVRFVARQPHHQVILPWRKGQRDGSLPGLLGSIDKNIRSSRMSR